LAFLRAESPDLALVVERWDVLPGAIRKAITALATSSEEHDV
jgi:hypothetical protein